MLFRFAQPLAAIVILIFLVTGCQTTYYAVWEKLGKEKRHLLKDNVEKVKKDQEEASEQFESVVAKIKALYGFDGGELEDVYEKLKDEYQECEERAETVRDRIDNVEEIASDLFKEWEKEINAISNVSLKSKSRLSLQKTRLRYKKLEKVMKRAEKKMEPVLRTLNDYVLYLKHNLNAKAVGALKGEVREIEQEVFSLVSDMQKSIKEANDFVKTME